mgnify:CR=1 FL=1
MAFTEEEKQEAINKAYEKIDDIIDEIREKYGKTSVFRAYNLSHGSTFLHRSGYVGGHKGASSLNKEEKK